VRLDFYKEDGDAPGVIRLSLAAKIFLLDVSFPELWGGYYFFFLGQILMCW
jgi:hypothetical protein